MSIKYMEPKEIAKYVNFIEEQRKDKYKCKRPRFQLEIGLLNEKQRKAYNLIQKAVKKEEQLLFILHGYGGTGKSFVINSLRSIFPEEEDARVCVCCPTGIASTFIYGETIHAMFNIPTNFVTDRIEQQSVVEDYKLKSYLNDVKLIIIDEASMLGAALFGYMETKIRRVLGNDSIFGGKTVIIVFDVGQLDPPCSLPIFVNPDGDDEKQSGEKENTKILSRHGYQTYRKFLAVVCLTKMVRAEGKEFQEILLRFRCGQPTSEDLKAVNSRVLKKLPKEEQAVFDGSEQMFFSNDSVNGYNTYENTCCFWDHAFLTRKLKELGTPLVKMSSEHGPKLECPMLAPKAPIMLVKNIWTAAGLVNGQRGEVEDLVYPKGMKASGMPAFVTTKIRSYRGPYPLGWNKIPIPPSLLYKVKDHEIKKRMRELPMRVAFARTIHKCQGDKIKCGVINLSGRQRYPIVFTALSRFSKLEDIAMANFLHEDMFVKHDIRHQQAMAEEKRLLELEKAFWKNETE